MNDRAVNILEQYDLNVERTWKGRGSILFETKDGIYILKEYKGTPQRLSGIAGALEQIRENGYKDMETILPNKEGEFFCVDYDRTIYIVKSYFQAKECNIREKAEYLKGMKHLARLHSAMEGVGRNELRIPSSLPILSIGNTEFTPVANDPLTQGTEGTGPQPGEQAPGISA